MSRKTAFLILIAIAATLIPVLAQAGEEGPSWYLIEGESEIEIGEEPIALEEQAGVSALTITLANGFTIGPCGMKRNATIWNDAKGVGQDSTTTVTLTVPCKTSTAGCEATTATAEGLPWSSTLTDMAGTPYDQIGTKAKPMIFKFKFNLGCGALSGATVTATATAPVLAKQTGKGCFSYDKAGPFDTTLGIQATIDGEDCPMHDGKKIKAK